MTMSEPVHIRDLFNPELLEEPVLDEEIVLSFEKCYRIVKRYCDRNNIAWPVEFERFRDVLYTTWEKVERQTDEVLIERCKKGIKYVKANPSDIEAKILLVSIQHRLKKRGYNIDEVLSEKDKLVDVFGDLVYESEEVTDS